ncbi:GNAT family N-acetyltransferase [Corynebacterium hindlerae]|uniref:GNAT family N-acetyltransferase n=1 Tax=Corynebacterium hindlerae TaxID=699041 RepID=UPI0031B6B93D
MHSPTVRPATPTDVPEIHRLILALAEYEREPDAVRATSRQLHDALFSDNPAVHAIVVDSPETSEHALDGFALWFRNYSTWEGTHGIYLEDLYVREERRGQGIGGALLKHLAKLAVERGYARMEWSVLKWNEPSIQFYQHIGARPLSEWDTYRLTGDALKHVGSRREI